MTESDRQRLPAGLLASLYRNSLVGGAPSPSMREATGHRGPDPVAGLKGTLGGYGRSVLVLVEHMGEAVMPDGELTFLMNVLKACRLRLEDVLIANVHGLPAEARKSLLETHKPANLLLFGMEPAEIPLPMSFPPLKVQRHGPSQYLYAPALQTVQGDDAVKRTLWASLKTMFGI